MSKKRPEHQAPPEIYYNDTEARKYSTNSRIIDIQQQLSERAVELLNLPEGESAYILDLGCGSGLSGEVLTDAGHVWVGLDISSSMLEVSQEREVEGDLILSDMGHGLPFRPGTFDGAISISALQWLCNADKKCNVPARRLYHFFSTLYASLGRGARCVFQLYPDTSAQIDLITQQSVRAGFSGGLVVDYPHSTKAKKMYLCLFTSGLHSSSSHPSSVNFTPRSTDLHLRGKPQRGVSVKKGSREWIMKKKEKRRNKGKEVKEDSKYTGRKRKDRW